MDRPKLLLIQPNDNVAIALSPLEKGAACAIGGRELALLEDIPAAFKVALEDIPAGGQVVKYGLPIGHATRDIRAGELVHIHNVITNLEGVIEYEYHPDRAVFERFAAARREASFEGYLRPDGSAGTRNELWIVPTVGCVNQTARLLADEAQKRYAGRLDGVRALCHNAGCSQLGNDMLTTQRLLRGLINNPNAGAVLVISLGCENNCLEYFRPVLGEVDPRRVKFLVTQDHEDELAEGMALLDELADYAASFQRQTLPASKLRLGLKCGSSDAFSGVSANPLVGRMTDRVVECGGMACLTEVSEMFGAETRLMDRAVSREVFDEVVHLINDCKEYFIRYGQPIDRNPAPGNIRSGISTDEDKSMGNIQKGGSAPVVDVLWYGDRMAKPGLSLMTGSGNDAISVTNLAAAGANLILFTTGNGNPFGGVVPTIKVSSNSRLYGRKGNWIDFNAGQVLDGTPFEEAADALFGYMLDVASGRERTNSEKDGYQEISIFRDGVIL